MDRHIKRRRGGTGDVNQGSDYDDDETQFMRAMDAYKRDNDRPFPAWSEVLGVLKALGYRKVSPPKMEGES